MDKNYLTYGCIISISNVLDDDSFVTSDGFVKRVLYNMNFHKIDLVTDPADLAKEKIRSYFNSLFAVFPKFTNSIKQEILKEISPDQEEDDNKQGAEAESVLDNLMNSLTHLDKLDDQLNYNKEEIINFQNRLLNEFKSNLDSFEKTKNLKIAYKQSIQLLHLSSAKFLACHQKEARFEPSNYKIVLDDFPSEATLFKILPAYKYQKEGEQLVYDCDIVYIIRAAAFMNKLTYLHVSGEMYGFGKTKQGEPAKMHQQQQQQQKKKASKNKKKDDKSLNQTQQTIIKREVNASLEEKTQWRIILFQEYIPEYEGSLKCGEVIWLHHSETNTALSVHRKGKSIASQDFSQFDILKWMSADNLCLKVTEAATKESYDEYIGDTYSMWIIEYETYMYGGCVQYDRYYRFRHLPSGLYLACSRKLDEKATFYLTKQRIPESLFRFQPLKNSNLQNKIISKGSYVYVQNQVDLWVDVQLTGEVEQNEKTPVLPTVGRPQKHVLEEENKFRVVLHDQIFKIDQSVFKLYASTSSDVVEIRFVLSCLKVLTNYLADLPKLKWNNDASDKEMRKEFSEKISNTKACVMDIDAFCNNKLQNSSPEQKYASINPFRQKLLKEQFYIEVLIKILVEGLNAQELELWENRQNIKQENDKKQDADLDNIQVQPDMASLLPQQGKGKLLQTINTMKKASQFTGKLLNKSGKGISQIELLQFTALKVDLAVEIYKLIQSICFHNHDNQIYTFQLIPNVVHHMKIIPQAIYCLISIISQNQMLITKLSQNLIIQFNMDCPPTNPNQVLKPEDQKNLIVVFFNLLEDETTHFKAQYLRFLRSICRLEDQGINSNQETIYKLYKLFRNNRLQIKEQSGEIEQSNKITMSKGVLQIPNAEHHDMNFIIEQMQFYADVSFNRNYTWKKELEPQFKKEYLFDNIWKDNVPMPRLAPFFCLIAMSLYIDHDPLNRKPLPDFCRLFKGIDQPLKQSSELKHPEVFQQLIDQLMEYLQKRKEEVDRNMKDQVAVPSESVSQEELLLNSMNVLHLILELDLFTILDQFGKFSQIINILITFLRYDKKNIKFAQMIISTQEKEMEGRKERKKEKKDMLSLGVMKNMNPFAMMKKMVNFVKQETEEEEEEAEENEDEDFDNKLDDAQVYTNPLIRGYIKLNNQLEELCHEDFQQNPLETQLKLKICDILDFFLNLRQDFLLTNLLTFFKNSVVNGVTNETKEEKQKLIALQEQGKSDDEIRQARNQILIEKVIKNNILGILPNIARTGIQEVDEPKKEDNDPFAMFKLGKDFMNNMFTDKKPEFFKKVTQAIEIYDLDGYYSLNFNDTDLNEGPIACYLPFMLTTFYYIHNEHLERRSLSIIMRLFNQREELIQNMNELQIIFDPAKTKLFSYLQIQGKRLTQLVDQSEIWMSEFIKKNENFNASLDETTTIIKNLRNAFFDNIVINNSNIEFQNQRLGKIDGEKQQIMNALKIQEPIINMIKDQIHQLVECLQKQDLSSQQKIVLVNLFNYCYQFLKNFCQQNHANQQLLFQSLPIFTLYLQYDLGQFDLIAEIFKDNQQLLTTQVQSNLLQIFVNLIETYGRQEHFLSLFLIFMRYRDKYLFDNQLQILNLFLKQEQNSGLLFNEKSKSAFEFSFQGEIQIIDADLISKIENNMNVKNDQPFKYHRKLLELLLATTFISHEKSVYNPGLEDIAQRDNFTISVAKIRKIFTWKYLVKILCKPDSFTGNEDATQQKTIFQKAIKGQSRPSKKVNDPKVDEQVERQRKGFSILKQQVCQFTRYIHLTSEKTAKSSKELAEDFIRLVEFETQRFEQMNQNEKLKRYMEYLTEGVLPFFISYYERVIAANVQQQHQMAEEEEMEDQEKDQMALEKFSHGLIHAIKDFLFKSLSKKREVLIIRRFFEHFPNELFTQIITPSNPDDKPQQEDLDIDMIDPQVGDKKSQQQEIDEEVRARFNNLFSGMEVDNEDIKHSQPEEQPQDLNIDIADYDAPQRQPSEKNKQTQKIMMISSLMKKKENKKLFDISDDQDLTIQQAIEIETLWLDFRLSFSTLLSIEDEVEKETEMLANALLNIDKYLPKKCEYKLDLKLYIKKFINFLQYAVNSPSSKPTIIKLLSTLGKMITKETDPEKKTEIQILFNKLGATRTILMILSESSSVMDDETFKHFINFTNALLDEGNIKVQRTVYEFFTTYPKSEVIFQRFNEIILRQIESITVKAKETRAKKRQMLEDPENYEQQQQFDNSNEQKQSQEDEKVMNQVLKFLQNCVEGHYLDLQNYIRQQTNSRNSYNMINLVADLLRVYYYEDRSQMMYDNMIRCLDTLNELVQGPCLENQVAVSESKFFEIASDLFTQKKEKDKSTTAAVSTQTMNTTKKTTMSQSRKSSSGEDLADWMIARLQMKCLILILSLIEMRELSEQNPIIKRIMRNLPMPLIQRHMIKCYKKYLNIYKDEYIIEVFDHVKEDPRKLEKEYQEGYFETIIQNGFYIFFLMSYYMECDKKMDNQFVQLIKQYRKKKLKVTKGTLEDLLFGDNIIGQLVNFGMSLVQQGLSILSSIKSLTYDKLMKSDDLSPEELERQEQEKLQRKKRILKKAFDFYSNNSASIEVIRNDNIEIVYFILLPYTQKLPKEIKIEFHDKVDRSSTKSKVQNLINESDRLIEICKHEETLKRFFNQQKFIAIFANYVKLWKDLAYIFTLLLNLFIIGSFSNRYGDRMEDYHLFQMGDYTTDETKNIFQICGIIMSCCSIFVVLFFLCKNAPLIVKKAWNEKTPFEGPNTGLLVWLLIIVVKLITVLIFILKEIEVMYYLAYGTFAVIGTVVHPFFFAFHLTEILIRYPTLKNVVRAVWEPKEQLFLTLILFIILVYVYGLLAYTFFSADYNDKCNSTLMCFLFTFDWTFKANGGVGGYLTDIATEDENYVEEYPIGRFSYDNSSNIILVIIMVNIVAGIIIDTFGSLREEENIKLADIEDKCFICGNLKTTFDRHSDNAAGGGFVHHIKISHYMWNYLFFIAYLEYKDSTEYTGIEQYIAEKLSKQDLNWFPFNKARELNLDDDDEEEMTKISKIDNSVMSMVTNIEKVSKILTSIQQQNQAAQNQNNRMQQSQQGIQFIGEQ